MSSEPAKLHLLDSSGGMLEGWLAARDLPKYRAAQVRRWLFNSRAADFESMSDLSKGLRTALTESFHLWTTKIARHLATDDGTEKLLLELHDGHQVECVLLRDGTRRTICISSQVGCAMGCVFCASGIGGVVRNLTAGEIIEQMLRLDRLLPAEERLSHIVVMGMGEPLANLDRLLVALDAASSPDGLGISARRITISTVGLPPALRKLTALAPGYQLAVSLHAADDELRTKLVPVNRNIGLADIMAAADEYFEASGRRLTFEYVLLADVNDSPAQASKLGALLRGRTAMLNVIPYNPVAGLPYTTPSRHALAKFLEVLDRHQINVQVRERKGDRINAACGQLRRDYLTSGAPATAEQPPAI